MKKHTFVQKEGLKSPFYCSQCNRHQDDSVHYEPDIYDAVADDIKKHIPVCAREVGIPIMENTDSWNPPKHPLGIDAIEITRHMTFNVGNVVKYLFRPHYKGKEVEDLKKARFYLDDEIKRLESLSNESKHV